MGERQMPSNLEANVHKITTIYEELRELNKNNDVLDLSVDNIYDNLDFENYCKDLSIIHNAKTNIVVGIGGHLCNSFIFGKELISYTTKNVFTQIPLNLFALERNNSHIRFNLFKFLDKIKEDY